VLKEDAEKENARIEKQKKVIEEQLKEVEPLIKAAQAAVGSIKNDDLTIIRSLRAPPEVIRDILEAVLLFMGIYDSSWQSMRRWDLLSFLNKEMFFLLVSSPKAASKKRSSTLTRDESRSKVERRSPNW